MRKSGTLAVAALTMKFLLPSATSVMKTLYDIRQGADIWANPHSGTATLTTLFQGLSVSQIFIHLFCALLICFNVRF